MLADELDFVVGVDPHRDSHALAVAHVVSGAVVFEASIAASSEGYAQALRIVDGHVCVLCTPPSQDWRRSRHGRAGLYGSRGF